MQKFATFFAKYLHWIYKARSKFIANFMQVLCKLINSNFCRHYQNIVWLQRNCKINCLFYCKLDANKCFVLLRVKPFILHFFCNFLYIFFAKRLQVSLVKTIISTFNILHYFCKKHALPLANLVLNFCKTLIFGTFGAGWKIVQINLFTFSSKKNTLILRRSLIQCQTFRNLREIRSFQKDLPFVFRNNSSKPYRMLSFTRLIQKTAILKARNKLHESIWYPSEVLSEPRRRNSKGGPPTFAGDYWVFSK